MNRALIIYRPGYHACIIGWRLESWLWYRDFAITMTDKRTWIVNWTKDRLGWHV